MIYSVHADGRFVFAGRDLKCALGRSGVIPAALKQEGDGATPAGLWPLRALLWRPDRGPAPKSRVPMRPIVPDDGWCDFPADRAYNRLVRLPYPSSAERLWRDDGLYDLVVTLGHNDEPVVPGAGSAIFLHIAPPGYEPTKGCIALAADDLAAFLSDAGPEDSIRVLA